MPMHVLIPSFMFCTHYQFARGQIVELLGRLCVCVCMHICLFERERGMSAVVAVVMRLFINGFLEERIGNFLPCIYNNVGINLVQ